MTRGLTDLLDGGRGAGRVFGVVSAVVTDNLDDLKLGRVRLRFPWLGDDSASWWARVAVPLAGPERGTWVLPEVGDEVLVAFEHGDPRVPYVIGGLWNQNAMPPEDTGKGGADHRSVTSRSGHVIRLDDSDGAEKIEIIDGSGKNRVVIRTSDDSIEIAADGDVALSSANGKVTITGAEVEIKASGSASLQAGSSLELKADGKTVLKGATVAIN
jgi:uncharacterized protein involved in type VI secretion and phage assembly